MKTSVCFIIAGDIKPP